MGAHQSDVAKDIQNTTSNIFEETQETCVGNCTAIQSDDTVVISGTIFDNFKFNNQCRAHADCAMSQKLDAEVSSIMSAIAEQENTSSSIWPANFKWNAQNNKVTIRQSIRNNITQIMSSVCQSTSNNIQNNDVFVFQNSVGGDIVVNNQGSANSTCSMNNLARQVVFNKQTAKTKQTNKIDSLFTTIMIIIVVIIIIGALLALLFLGPIGLSRLTGSSGNQKSKNDSDTDNTGKLQQLLSTESTKSGTTEAATGSEASTAAEGAGAFSAEDAGLLLLA